MCFRKKEINHFEVVETFEDKLLNEYGRCDIFSKNITLLCIADTHGGLLGEEENLRDLSKMPYDICVLFGDHSYDDIELVLKYIPTEKIVGLLGNYDQFNTLEYFNIDNINKKIININGVSIAGIQGSFKYSTKNLPYYTHEESSEILNSMPKADILLSHDKAFIKDNDDPAHDGLKGITEYLYKNKIPIHVHGHIHINETTFLQNGTKSICVNGCKLLHF